MPIGKIPQNGSRQMKPWDPECHRPNLDCAQFTYTDVALNQLADYLRNLKAIHHLFMGL